MKRREALKNTAVGAGALGLSGTLLALLQSCKEQVKLDWSPKFLSVDEARLVAALIDTILPTTETPGGLDVNIDVFMDGLYAEIYDDAGRQGVQAELKAFDQKAKDQYGKAFADMTAEQRVEMLRAEEENSPTFNPGVWGTSVGDQEPVGFYRSFKSTAIWAYCSSEKIATEVLKYDPIPGPYIGCYPLADAGGVWSY